LILDRIRGNHHTTDHSLFSHHDHSLQSTVYDKTISPAPRATAIPPPDLEPESSRLRACTCQSQSTATSSTPFITLFEAVSFARTSRTNTTALSSHPRFHPPTTDDDIYDPPPPHPEASSSGPSSPKPPPFSSLYFPPEAELQRIKAAVTESINDCLLVTAPAPSFEEALAEDEAERKAAADKVKESSTRKGESSGKGLDDGEPPPPYTEGSSPLDSFTYVMAAAGGPASIITQVQQSPGPPINTLGGEYSSFEELSLPVSNIV
jgi:hypothetical protein